MNNIKLVLLSGLLLFSVNSMALNLYGTTNTNEESLYDSRSCNTLYAQASALEQDTYINQSNFYSDGKTRVATYALTAFVLPAVSYLGYNTYQNYKASIRSEAALSEIDHIRRRMAEKRCFEK